MQEFRDGHEHRPSSPPASQPGSAPSFERLEEVGDLHFHAAAYTSAVDYYRTALDASGVDGDPGHESQLRLLRLHCKLGDCFRVQGQLKRALAEFATAVDLATDLGGVEVAATELRLARVLQAQGRYDEAIDLATRSFTVLSLTDRHGDVAISQMVLGIANACRGQLTKAEEFFQDALATYRRIDDQVSQGHVLNNLALLAKRACRWSRALQLYDRAESLFQRRGANVEICAIHLNKAVLLRKMGNPVEARASAQRGLKLARTRGDQGGILRFDLVLGQLAIDSGALAQAQDYLLEARVLAESEDSRRDLALADEFLGDLMFARGDFEDALANYDRAADRARRISSSNDILAEVARRRAHLFLTLGSHERALDEAAVGLQHVDSADEEFERGFLERTRGAALAALGRNEDSRQALQASLETFRRLHLDCEVYHTLVDLARTLAVSEEEGALLVARARLNEALAMELPLGDTVCRSDAQLELAEVELALGGFDEALIALFELERADCSSGETNPRVAELRERIEIAMSEDAQDSVDSLQLLTDLPDLVGGDGRHDTQTILNSLQSAASRLGASRSFVASRDERGRVEILANDSIPAVTAKLLAARAWELLGEQEAGSPRVWTKALQEQSWISGLAENRRPLDAVVAIRLFDPKTGHEGLFYFDASVDAGRTLSLDADALAVVSTCAELLRRSVLGCSKPNHLSNVEHEAFAPVITQSDKLREVLALCAKVAPSPYTVLFTGETGTGKGLLAKIIHELSPRRQQPLVSVNCAAIPEALLESELFGHIRGAFTGAERDKNGLIVSADHGTLFLDEIGKMPLPMQAKLLHFLDSREVRPVGSSASREVDVRVLCASKSDLETMVAEGRFLEDLYYRLLDFPIEIPPLRDRGEDIVLLAREFVTRASADLERSVPTLTRGFVTQLRSYRWPGNVRELEKAMRRAVVLASDEPRLRDSHLPGIVASATADPGSDEDHSRCRPLKEQVAELERTVLQQTLDSLAWNRSEAARQLKISYPTLLQKIRNYGLQENC